MRKKTITPEEIQMVKDCAAKVSFYNAFYLIDREELAQELYAVIFNEALRRPQKWGEPEEEWLNTSTRNFWEKWLEYREAGQPGKQRIALNRAAYQITEVMIEAHLAEHCRQVSPEAVKVWVKKKITVQGSIPHLTLRHFDPEIATLLLEKFSTGTSASVIAKREGLSVSSFEKKCTRYLQYTRWAMMQAHRYNQEGYKDRERYGE